MGFEGVVKRQISRVLWPTKPQVAGSIFPFTRIFGVPLSYMKSLGLVFWSEKFGWISEGKMCACVFFSPQLEVPSNLFCFLKLP